MKSGETGNTFSGIEGALLFALLVPLTMKYTLLPVHQTPYWYFGCIFAAAVSYVVIGFWNVPKKGKSIESVKNILFWFLMAGVLFGSMVTIIADRGRLARGLNYYTHDIVLQLEAAQRFLSEGKNPYRETYFNTPLASWLYTEPGRPDAVNPALYHFVMPSWYLVSAFPVYWVSMRTVGYFDGRMPLFLVSAVLFISLFWWFGKSTVSRLAVMLLALNPATVGYLMEGRSDFFALSFLVASFICIERKSVTWASVFLALAICSKQTIWFVVPLYMVYVFRVFTDARRAIFIMGTVIVALICTLPFLLWDPKAFVDSVILYLTGNTAVGYPVSGYGLGMMLHQFGIITDTHAYYPFIYWQIILGIPSFLIAGYYIWKKPALSRLILSYGVILFILWYVSRYFNNSHVSYLTSIFLLAYFRNLNEKGLV